MDREFGISLLRQYIHDPHLINHCLATGAIMKATAVSMNEQPSKWELGGILHDIDYEIVAGDMKRHGTEGAKILQEYNVDPDICDIVCRHNHYIYQGDYTRPVDIALQAADAISGLIIACALVKGGRLSDITPKTVSKKIKEKGFAAGCDRTRIALASRLMDLSDYYCIAINGMLEIRNDLNLA